MFTASPSTVVLSSIVFIIALISIRTYRLSTTATKDFPPGPPTLPFLGNLHQLPTERAYLKFTQWSREYGSIIGLRFGPHQKVVLLNSWRAVKDLFDQRGATYSSRPDIPIADYVVPESAHVAFMKYGQQWRRGRTMMTNFLKDEELAKLLPIQDAESTQMLWEVLQEPEKYHSHVMRQFCAVILASVYGQRGQRTETEEFFRIQGEWASMLDPGAFPPLDVFPWLKYVPSVLTPWSGWRRRAAELKRMQNGFYAEMFQRAKKRVESGEKKEIFAWKMLERQEKEGFSDTELAYFAGFLIEAGADTTANSLLVFMLAMAAYPDVQKKAQAEVDGIFTSERMPTGADIGSNSMPYLQALFWEILRWVPVLPVSLPHATTQDDTYGRYFIPAGTTVIMNVWAIHHDPDEYPNPDVFDPSRFLNNEFGAADASQDNASRRKTYAFGAARRVCAGQSMAEKSLLLSMAKILWAFDIRHTGEGKLDTNVETAFTSAILIGVKEVGFDFGIRGETKREVVEREWKKADAFLRTFE